MEQNKKTKREREEETEWGEAAKRVHKDEAPEEQTACENPATVSKPTLEEEIRSYVAAGQLNLPAKTLKALLDTNSVTNICDAISQLIQQGVVGFPFKKYFITAPNVLFENLRDYKTIFKYGQSYKIPALHQETRFLVPFHYQQKSLLWPSEKSDYDRMNSLSDTFQEKARLQSVIRNQKSTMATWNETSGNTTWLRNLVSREKNINTYELREALYEVCKGEPSTFKATVAKSFFSMIWSESKKPLRILDFCSGWGDRLLGALACYEQIEHYYGVDPNNHLFEGYAEMKNTLGVPNPDRFHMVNSPFESWQIPPELKFNLIFTGPPYFDYELYGDGTNQSTTTFPDPINWAVLDEGGVMALNVCDTINLLRRGIYYTEAMVLYAISHLRDCIYEGVICFTGANFAAPRPIWVFKKKATRDQSKKIEAERLLERYYPKIWKVLKEEQRKW